MAAAEERGGRSETDVSDPEQALLDEALKDVPSGAIAVASAAVLLLMVGWFFLYLFVFLPRGSVG